MILVCDENNDLYRTLAEQRYTLRRLDSPSDGLAFALPGSGLLILADAYPRPGPAIDADFLAAATAKDLRLLIEYPSSLPGLALGEPTLARWERVVVASDFFAPALEKHTILAMHGCWFTPTQAASPHLVLARVAGYREAVYGLPHDTHPILFELLSQNALIATSKLSQFITARYAPKPAWQALWHAILRWLAPMEDLPPLDWAPTVGVYASPGDRLPADAEGQAFDRSVKWFRDNVVFNIGSTKGATEGFQSAIDHEGRQMRLTVNRADCMAETAMVFAHDWATGANPASRRIAAEILDTVWLSGDYYQSDPESPVYGLVNWMEKHPVFYGDDNARVMLPTLAAARLLNDDRWDERVFRCLLAHLRTTGPLGFRNARFDYPQDFTEGRGWQHYRDAEVIHYAPHYQAYLWAGFLWAYALTGYEPFLAKARNAIRMTVEAFPTWSWTNGLTQEMARMLLPLAFLVRVEDTLEHRFWLDRIAAELLAHMQPSGAIYERLGLLEDGAYPSPRSNEDYGTTEASLIQENGDPACDLLYTTNFAFLGLHEAAAATGDTKLKEAEHRLAEFLCRIQVRSTAHPYLDGAWMRAFDDQLWEHWGSSADLGWGAWSVESGWTNTWIASVLAMRGRGDTLFDPTLADRLRPLLRTLLEEMCP